MKIVDDVDFIFDARKTKLIGLSVGETSLDAAAGHPDAEAFFVVMPTSGKHLHETDTLLDKPSRQQTIAAEIAAASLTF